MHLVNIYTYTGISRFEKTMNNKFYGFFLKEHFLGQNKLYKFGKNCINLEVCQDIPACAPVSSSH